MIYQNYPNGKHVQVSGPVDSIDSMKKQLLRKNIPIDFVYCEFISIPLGVGISRWIEENCNNYVIDNYDWYYFLNKHDAVKFKLRWAGS